jgi:hypothetical protein
MAARALLIAGVACSLACAASSGSSPSAPSFNAGRAGGGGAPNAIPNASPSATLGGNCTAGQTLACFCPDGTQTGKQSCLAGGVLGACTGCKTARALDAPASTGPLSDGKLCPKLAGQSGCTAGSFQAQRLPPSILFLLDRSGSMMCNPPESGQTSESCDQKAETLFFDKPTKWAITIDAVGKMVANLVDSGASAGLTFFSNNDVCGVNSLPNVPLAKVADAQLTRVRDALSSMNPSGGTPIVGATILAYDHLYAEAGADGAGCAAPPCGAPGNRFVVLITDGADSCPAEPIPGACGGGSCTDYLLDHSVGDAARVNIRTFVIGVPGSEPARGFLSELALRGGTAKNGGNCTGDRKSASGDCHFDMTTSRDLAGDLGAALSAISGAALSCEFPVPQSPNRTPSKNVNVQYRSGGSADPMCIGYDERPCAGGANGWQFSKDANGQDDLSKVVLCGDACQLIKSDPKVRVDVVLGCQPLVTVH